MKVLVINAGSSSLKYQLMDTDTRTVLAKGLCERIGIDGRLTHKVPAKDLKLEFEIAMPTHAEAIQSVLDALTSAEHGVHPSGPPAQSRQHHRHQGLPGRYALHSHGGRVRHRLPSDDARQELYLCPALRVL